MNQKTPIHKKFICSMLAGVITTSCFIPSYVNAETVSNDYEPISYTTYDMNGDGDVNVFDSVYLRRFLIASKDTENASVIEANNNQSLKNARYAVEQYIKNAGGELLANVEYINTVGFTDSETNKISNSFVSIVKFKRFLSEDELTSVCMYNTGTYEKTLASELIQSQTPCHGLRVTVTDGEVVSVVPGNNVSLSMKKTKKNNHPSYLTYDINKDNNVSKTDVQYMNYFLLGNNPAYLLGSEMTNRARVIGIKNVIKAYISNYSEDLASCMASNIFVNALMTTTGVVEEDFTIGVWFTRGLDSKEINEICTDKSCFNDSDFLSNVANGKYKYLHISVIDGEIASVVPSIYATVSYYMDLVAENISGVDVNQIMQALNHESDILFSKVIDIDADTNGEAVITFDAPLSANAICVLTGFDATTDYSDYRDKATKARVYKDGDTYKFTPILE